MLTETYPTPRTRHPRRRRAATAAAVVAALLVAAGAATAGAARPARPYTHHADGGGHWPTIPDHLPEGGRPVVVFVPQDDEGGWSAPIPGPLPEGGAIEPVPGGWLWTAPEQATR